MALANTKAIAIVLEAAEPSLVEQWCREGRLPVLQRLREKGVWSLLASPSFISSGCAWPSLNLGTNPGKHGIGFFHREIENGTYRIIRKRADSVKGTPFWENLGAAGHRVAVFDMATTRPNPEINGVIVVDWGSEHPSWKTSSHPPELISDIHRRFGRHPLHRYYQERLRTIEDCEELAEKLFLGIERRTRIIRYLGDLEDFDFLFCSYAETHWAGHLCWHLHDTEHPEHDPALSRYGELIRQTYEACDRAIGELLDACPDANVLVLSNVGMGSHAGGDMMMPVLLERLGLSRPSGATHGIAGRLRRLLPASHGPMAAIQRVERIVSSAWLRRFRALVPERLWDHWTRRMLGAGSGWAQSRVFVLPGDNSSLLRINLKGREPRGLVAPEEYDTLCAEVTQAFTELVDPATGQRAVRRVIKCREMFHGDEIDQLPDLAIEWAPQRVPLQALESPRIGRVELVEPNKRPGGHWHDGFLVATGPAFRCGVCLPERDLMDIAPTVLALFGIPTPDYMDGKAIADALVGPPAAAGARVPDVI